MWWRIATTIHNALNPSTSFDEKIIRSCAERLIRRRILGQNHRDPEQAEVDRYVKKVMVQILKKFNDYALVRRNSQTDNIEPIVAEFVDALYIKK